MKDSKTGFTLIELVIVVSIIAVLSGVSLFALSGARESGRDARRRSDLSQIASGLELYKADFNYYPDSITAGGSLSGGGNTYIQVIPSDPTGSAYAYTPAPFSCSGNCMRFCVWATLEETTTTPTYCNATNCGSVPGGFNYCVTNP